MHRNAAPLALALLLLAACGAEPPAQQPDAAAHCNGACGPGTTCSGGRCVAVEADAAGLDAAADDGPQPAPDAPGLEVAPLDGPAEASTPDAAPPADAPVDLAPDVALDAPGPDGCGDTSNDPNNCGACGTRCEFPNAAARCNAGRCELGACAPGFADCNGRNADGCEVDTGEAANCGACDNRCPSGVRCVGGRCEGGCPAGFWHCFGSCRSLDGDSRNCGACGRTCAAGQTCSGGICCAGVGVANCDGNAANGCETDVTTNDNCGACGNRCSLAPRRFCSPISNGTMVTGYMCR